MATKSIAWNTGNGNITLTYQGQGDGTITVSSDPNNLGTKRSQIINIKTTAGSPVITRELTVSQAVCPFPVGDVRNFSYTGSYQEIELPAGQYKLQVWGAQGGSNAAASSYNITAQAGGKGGYSEGIITLSQKTTVRVYVGGAGSSSAGGFNGGGSTTGSASYNSGNEQGVSRMGGGGGATDIRLSYGALLSRMIVAGGGSGGAMCYKKIASSVNRSETLNWLFNKTSHSHTISETVNWEFYDRYGNMSNMTSHSMSGGNASYASSSSANLADVQLCLDLSDYIDKFPITVSFNVGSAGGSANLRAAKAVDRTTWTSPYTSEFVNKGSGTGTKSITLSDTTRPVLFYYCNDNRPGMSITGTSISYTETSNITHSASGGNMSWSCNSDSDLSTMIVYLDLSSYTFPLNVEFTIGSTGGRSNVFLAKAVDRTAWDKYSSELTALGYKDTGKVTLTLTDSSRPILFFYLNDNKNGMSVSGTKRTWSESSTTETNESQVGFVGGGTNGGGYNSSYYGKQNAAGTNGSFGQGANQTATNYRYCSGAGGGGWYGGGGGRRSDSDMNYCKQSGGGSGFVNTAANASYRPSGYTGLQLDSGETKAGNSSFPAPSGGNETGHSGNGYARITRLA